MKNILYIFLFFALAGNCFGQKDSSEVFTVVETMPQPTEGMEAFKECLRDNLVYPASRKDANNLGKCYLKFIVEKDGSISHLATLKGISGCPECDQEAIRVFKACTKNKWYPGIQGTMPVRVYFNIVINF